MTEQIVKRAGAAFQQGDYQTAKQLYQQAAAKYGQHLFAANLALCDRAVHGQHPTVAAAAYRETDDAALGQQLAETQRLLEHYFTRCQQLEHQLMERQSVA